MSKIARLQDCNVCYIHLKQLLGGSAVTFQRHPTTLLQ